ncbi:MAG: class I SAM-dependent methyltransferase, partial [Rickettsiales bacterium]
MFEHTALWKCVQTAGAQASPSKETLEALADPQLCLALCNSVVGILPFEQALIAIRKCCLLDWTLADIPLVLLAAFAYQGFRNEYVWEIGPDEQAACDALAAKAKAGTLGISELFLLAAYRPLHRIEGIETCEPLLEKDDSGFARDIWRQQVEEPQEEEQIKPEIPVLTSIEDTVSQNVQAQYEVNPYPRWSTLDTVEPLEFKTHFERAFPHYPYITAIPSSCDVLVAGSGSGKQPLTLANTFKRFHVTGVDLSKTSLAYAIRKQKEVAPGVTVKFAQADILKLEEAFEPESFDMVQCTGVLHHMDDPMAGWKVLHRLLKPKGLMKIGLYSEIARRGVTVLREKIAKEGLPYTDEGIRRLREHIKAHPDEPDYKWVLQTIDFYSTSACRDLLFHVQEHQFTIPKIEAAIAELGLEFIGWDHPSPHVPKAFNEKFPEHEPPGSFEQWDT